MEKLIHDWGEIPTDYIALLEAIAELAQEILGLDGCNCANEWPWCDTCQMKKLLNAYQDRTSTSD